MALLNYKCEIPPERVAQYREIEDARQALMRGEATKETLAYARYLTAVDNDATFSQGAFKPFAPDSDEEIFRQWPFLSALMTASE